jgi:hypothetical protein
MHPHRPGLSVASGIGIRITTEGRSVMAPVTHQTIRLKKGRHSSPEEGACVMELASMLAGEPFTDFPVAVCPVIGAVLRSYNDSIDDERRQDLYDYASKVVGTRASAELEFARLERVRDWVAELRPRRWGRLRLPARWRALAPSAPIEIVGARAIRAVGPSSDQNHGQVLALIDELIEMGAPRTMPPISPAPASPSLSAR